MRLSPVRSYLILILIFVSLPERGWGMRFLPVRTCLILILILVLLPERGWGKGRRCLIPMRKLPADSHQPTDLG